MKYSDYWTKRQEERLAITDREVNKNIKQLESVLEEAANNLKDEIIKLFSRYATDNQLTYQEALKNVSEVELKNLKKDLAYYIDNAKYNATSMREELQRISTRVRVNRLEAYITRIKMYADNLEGILASETQQMLQDVYVESYLYNLYAADTLKNVSVNVSFSKPNERQLKTLIEYPWSGKNYSSKIWAKTYDFVDNVSRVITVGLIQGKNSDSIAKELHKAIMGEDGKGGQLYKYKRLVRTETAYIVEQATKKSYEDFGVEKYQFLATLDLRTSVTCQNLDKDVFPIEEAKVGVNYPPMHCFCRSTTIPIVKWDDEEDDDDTRIARDINGKSVFVKNQSYKEWKKANFKDSK